MQTILNYNNRSETKPNYTGETSNRQNDDEDLNAPMKARCDSLIPKYQDKVLQLAKCKLPTSSPDKD